MKIMEAILGRHSIRCYTDEVISNEILMELCNAGMAAPSANNTRPWEFIIINEKNILKKMSELRHNWKTLAKANAAIVVAGTRDKYFEQNCAAATQNILLAGMEYRIGSVWLGLQPDQHAADKIQHLLSMPGQVEPFSVVALGYPLNKGIIELRKQDNKKIHLGTYDKRFTCQS